MKNLNFQFPEWSKTESFLVNLGLVIIIFFLSLWLYLEFHFSIGNVGKPIGKITYRVNDSQRKFSTNFLWRDLEVNSDIYNFDTVRTDSSSKVYVMLFDKTEIQLEENSMVVFDLSKDNLAIDFLNGKLRLDSMNGSSNKKIKIISGDSQVNMENGMIQLNKIASASMNVNVLEGKAEIKKKDVVQNLEKGEEVKIRGEKLQKDKKKFRLLNPINSRYFLTKKSFDINFEWEGENTNDSYIIEIQNTSQKGNPVITKKVKGTTYSQTLNPGKYIWKLSDIERANTEADSFYIADDNPVTLYTPSPETFFEYETNPPRILFSWSKNEFIRYYKLEISETKTFDKIKYQLTTENETSIVDNLESGKYYYRLVTKTEFPDSVSKVSLINSFTINKKSDSVNEPKTEEKSLTTTNEDLPKLKLLTPKDTVELDTDRIQFSWEKSKGTSDYTLEISKSPEFTDISQSRKSSSNSLTVTLSENGKYYWRVKAKNQNENEIISNLYSFTYHFNPTPVIVFPKNDSEIDVLNMEKFVFKWAKMENAIYYSLELKRLANNELVIRESRLKSTDYSIDDFTLLKSGEYEVTLSARILTKNSEEITAKPKSHKFKIFLSQKAEKKDIKFITPDNVYIEH